MYVQPCTKDTEMVLSEQIWCLLLFFLIFKLAQIAKYSRIWSF